MLCNEVKRVVYFFLDETLGEGKKRDFSSHTSLCPDCAARVRVQERLRSIVKSKLEKMSAPDHLRTRLVRPIRAFHAEWWQ